MTRERLRIARDLHDTLAHSLMALLTQVRLIRKLRTRLGADDLDAELARCADEPARAALLKRRPFFGVPLLLCHGFTGAKEDFGDFIEPLADLDEDSWRTMWETNVLGAARTIKAFLPALEASQGSVIFIGSVHTRLAMAGRQAMKNQRPMRSRASTAFRPRPVLSSS